MPQTIEDVLMDHCDPDTGLLNLGKHDHEVFRKLIAEQREVGRQQQLFSEKQNLDQILAQVKEMGAKEARENIPVGFLRQWINEDIKAKDQRLVTNEDIMRFINIGYIKV